MKKHKKKRLTFEEGLRLLDKLSKKRDAILAQMGTEFGGRFLHGHPY